MNIQILILIAIIGFGIFLFFKFFKIPKLGSLVLVSGGVKTGKSTTSVYFATKRYKKNLIKVKITNFIRKIFRRPLLEEPLLYSNVPLKCKYVPLTKELLMRQKRFRYKSIIYIQEASLVADSQLIKNQDLNKSLLLLNKLISHETRGGTLIYDTQQLQDLHYSIKRSISNYFYIHSTLTCFPFFCVVKMREMIHNEADTINVVNSDIEESTKRYLIPKRVWKLFDCYCYSKMTDNLPVEDNVINGSKLEDLKVNDIVSFRDYLNISDNSNIDIKDINDIVDNVDFTILDNIKVGDKND